MILSCFTWEVKMNHWLSRHWDCASQYWYAVSVVGVQFTLQWLTRLWNEIPQVRWQISWSSFHPHPLPHPAHKCAGITGMHHQPWSTWCWGSHQRASFILGKHSTNCVTSEAILLLTVHATNKEQLLLPPTSFFQFYYIALESLEFAIYTTLTLNLPRSACLYLWCARINVICHYPSQGYYF